MHALSLGGMETRSEEQTIHQARDVLERYGDYMRGRDEMVARAHHAGVSKSEISRLTGIARTTVDRILDRG